MDVTRVLVAHMATNPILEIGSYLEIGEGKGREGKGRGRGWGRGWGRGKGKGEGLDEVGFCGTKINLSVKFSTTNQSNRNKFFFHCQYGLGCGGTMEGEGK